MLTIIRRIIGALLVLQCGSMFAFDLWLFSGMDLAYLRQYSTEEQTAIIVMTIGEAAGIALGLWLVLAKPKNARGENRLDK